MKFKTVPFFYGECQTCKGVGSITKLVKNNKLWKTSDEYVSKKTPCPDCKGKGMVKEMTGAQRFFPEKMARKEYLKRKAKNDKKLSSVEKTCANCDGNGYQKHYSYINPEQTKVKMKKYKCKNCDATGTVKHFRTIESTLSGAGYPAATDTAGGQAIDKAPTLLGRKKKKKKMARRIKVKTTFVS